MAVSLAGQRRTAHHPPSSGNRLRGTAHNSTLLFTVCSRGNTEEINSKTNHILGKCQFHPPESGIWDPQALLFHLWLPAVPGPGFSRIYPCRDSKVAPGVYVVTWTQTGGEQHDLSFGKPLPAPNQNQRGVAPDGWGADCPSPGSHQKVHTRSSDPKSSGQRVDSGGKH